MTHDRIDLPITINAYANPFEMANDDIINPDHLDQDRLRDLPHIMVDEYDPEPGSEFGFIVERPGFCHPRGWCQKLMVLFLMCLLGFGSYFCFDTPGALQDDIKSIMGVTTYQFASLYSWYSWPNVVLPIFGGYLIDRVLGLRIGAAFFAFVLILGQGCFALGSFADSFLLMEVGRFIFGIGGESLAVAQNTYATTWFSGDMLNTVFGLQLSVARLGSTACFQVTGYLYNFLWNTFFGQWNDNQILGTTLLVTALTCVMSFLASLVGCLDKRASRILETSNSEVEKVSVFPEDVISGLEHKHPLISFLIQPQQIRLADIKQFPLQFWIICFICVAYYVAIFPFVSLGQVFYIQKFDFSTEAANTINGLIYLISCFASPVFGAVIDRFGLNVFFVNAAVVATLLGHILLGFTTLNPYVGVGIIGVAYSMLASSLWPQITYVIPEHQRATAFGLMQAVQNAGLATITLLAGLIVDSFGYLWLEVFFMGCLCIALFGGIALWVVDARGNGILNMTRQERLIFFLKREHEPIFDDQSLLQEDLEWLES
eukprot:TCALIF_08667-PA protein Name:"Similar to MFSD1 Major facilitator superfamily domain-containing protein 1 (Bos taurus)" AED:0.10 eAED:0.10 QI:0/0.4/0.16/1/0.8/0.66/6/0/543